ncbi:MAG: cytochrome P450 [Anaerolineae bacterium]|nr:cytochrome P450 [Anaerolineae bacterium]
MKNRYPPGPKQFLLLGSLRQFANHRLEFMIANRDQFGDIVHFRFGPRHIYQINDPEMIQYVLAKHPEQFHKSPALKRNTRQVIGQGLLTSEDEFHKRQRRLVQPAFYHKRIAAYGDVMVDYSAQMLEGWHTDDQLDVAHEMMKLTMRIVAKTLFDADVSGDADSIGEAITMGIETVGRRITQPIHLPDWLPTPQNRERKQAAALLEQTITRMIDERRASGEDKGDLLSMLLMAVDEEQGGGMSNKQVRDEAMTLFIAGHETTANALAWTLYLLAQHPEVETRLVEELQSVLDGRLPAFADLLCLPYTEMVIKESMRLYPPAWVTTREVIEDIELGSYPIRKGSIIIMSIYTMHRDPRYWNEPDQFRPERFASGWEDRVPKYAYFPFGGGPRVCVGNQFAMMEAKLVLATIISRFQMKLVPGQQIVPDPLITLRPRDGIFMRLAAREAVTDPLGAICN